MSASFKLCVEIGIDDLQGLIVRDKASRQHEDIGIIVLLGECGQFRTPAESGADVLMLVEGHLDTIAGAAHGDAEIGFAIFHSLCGRVGVVGIVAGFFRVGAEVDGFVAFGGEVVDQAFLRE